MKRVVILYHPRYTSLQVAKVYCSSEGKITCEILTTQEAGDLEETYRNVKGVISEMQQDIKYSKQRTDIEDY